MSINFEKLPHENFENKEEYLQFRKEWKAYYMALSDELRDIKRDIKSLLRHYTDVKYVQGSCPWCNHPMTFKGSDHTFGQQLAEKYRHWYFNEQGVQVKGNNPPIVTHYTIERHKRDKKEEAREMMRFLEWCKGLSHEQWLKAKEKGT